MDNNASRYVSPFLPRFLITKVALIFITTTSDAVMLSTVHRYFLPAARTWLWRHVAFTSHNTPSSFLLLSSFRQLTPYITRLDIVELAVAKELRAVIAVLNSCRRQVHTPPLRLRLCSMMITGFSPQLLKQLVRSIEDLQLINCQISCQCLSDVVKYATRVRNFVLFSITILPSPAYEQVTRPTLSHCVFMPQSEIYEIISMGWFRNVILPSPLEQLSLSVFSLAGLHSITRVARTLEYLRLTFPLHNEFAIDNVPLHSFARLKGIRVNCVPWDFVRPINNVIAWAVRAPSLTELHLDVSATRFDVGCWSALRDIVRSRSSVTLLSVHFIIIVRFCNLTCLSPTVLKKMVFDTLQSDGSVTLPYDTIVKVSLAEPGSVLEKHYMTYF